MSLTLHPTAFVDPGARLGEGAVIGAFAVIEAGVESGPGLVVAPHGVILSGTKLGASNRVGSFAVLGGAPQDRSYDGEPTVLEVGDGNTFREHVTVHRGTKKGGGVTRVGSRNLLMVGVHVAHDCAIGSDLELANQTLLAGHVVLGDGVVTGGGAGIAPFVRVGRRAFVAAGSMVESDVPPFVIAAGDRARVRASNEVGLRRGGVAEPSRIALSKAFRAIFRGGAPRAQAAAALVDHEDPFVRELASFVIEAARR